VPLRATTIDAVKSVLERIEQLLALATSPNEHEARNAAVLAAALIRKHKVVLSMPARIKTPQPASPRRARSSPRGVKRVADPPDRIVAPLGGDCVHCGGRYGAGQTIYWLRAGGGLHVKCIDGWAKR
jgi:hypothetical protein